MMLIDQPAQGEGIFEEDKGGEGGGGGWRRRDACSFFVFVFVRLRLLICCPIHYRPIFFYKNILLNLFFFN